MLFGSQKYQVLCGVPKMSKNLWGMENSKMLCGGLKIPKSYYTWPKIILERIGFYKFQSNNFSKAKVPVDTCKKNQLYVCIG